MTISIDDVLAAARRLDGVAHRTPVLTSQTIDGLLDAQVWFKAENMQRTGSFKFRGAYNAINAMDPADRERGVVAYSSGNHAQAVALAARLHGVPACIVMPSDAPAAKVDATRGYGAEIVEYDRYTGDREAVGSAIASDRGLNLVPPYDNPFVMAGQGTATLELLADVPDLDVVVVPVGGGGLLAGTATVARAHRPELSVIGVEPEAGDDTRRSLLGGERVAVPLPRTIADGQQTTSPGALTWEVNKRLVDEVVVVSDDEIVDAMRLLLDRMKTVVEPSGATGLAALLNGRIDVRGRRIGVVLSGGNVGADRLAQLFGR
ncbi:MAG: threo-3-hydroxy-L-aspartate ammonia-lyase [Frankiaceae bacterium]|jgi:threonine dehydratase|nr:threo-3-hydroxy-L-aspartate ammonia-lyase [Frankiaceae bacterium]